MVFRVFRVVIPEGKTGSVIVTLPVCLSWG